MLTTSGNAPPLPAGAPKHCGLQHNQLVFGTPLAPRACRRQMVRREATREGSAVSRILIVDDDPDIVEAVRLVLGKEGHDVSSASNYSDGMTQLEQIGPELIILDVMMEEPDDGLRWAREARRKGTTIPIMMLTSVNATLGLMIGRDDEVNPVDAFYEKPIEPANLVEKVNQLLQK